ncbi:MAG: coenzyme F420-0:L-glutamate ligase [Candidatus Bathyarchaeia archaeon]
MRPIQNKVEVLGVHGIPLVKHGDDIVEMLCDALDAHGIKLQDGDILVVAQSIVSKAEGATVRLKDVEPSPRARIISEEIDKDPAVVEVILREADCVVRLRGGRLITRTRHGWVCANSAVDVSNVSGGDVAATLPRNPDASARRIREKVHTLTGRRVAVVISDTFGRPFRHGQVNVAIGVAGIKPIYDRRGEKDLYGYELQAKEIAVADELASTAELVMGEAAEGVPVAVIRGYRYGSVEDARISDLQRPLEQELFL